MSKNQTTPPLLFLLLCLLISGTAFAQESGTTKHGRLPNGLTYYIHETKDFGQELNCYLLQNIGAIEEKDNEQGMAHFLEHIAFNTTKHYPGGVMHFLQSNGILFNALTGLSETKYYLYSIPTNDRTKVDEALQLVRDWCGDIDINRKDVAKEKGIVTEEWRQRQGLEKRIQDAIAPVVYNHSPYAVRNVIGTPDGIRSITPKGLKDFYHKWYRPDLQCVILIGDYPVDELEQLVIARFSDLKQPTNAPKRVDPLIPDNESVLYEHFTDPENTHYSFGLYQRIYTPADPAKRNSIRDNLLSMIFNKLVTQRIGMIRNDGSEEFIAAVCSYAPLVRLYAQNSWDVVPYTGREKEALHQLLALRESIRRDGFTDEEFAPVQEAMYREIQELLSADKLGTPDNIMEVFRQNYLYGQPITSFRSQLTTTIETLVELTAEELNSWTKEWMTDRNLAFVTYASDRSSSPLSSDEFEQLLRQVRAEETYHICPAEPIAQLIPTGTLTPGKILSEKALPELGAKEWHLSNGSRMLYMPIPSLKGEAFFAGTAMGGHSIIAPEDLPSYNMMQSLLLQSGVGGHSRNSLARWLAGKSFDLSLNITETSDGIGGTTDTASLEEMMAYTHLILGQHSFAPETFRKQMQRQKYLYLDRKHTGMEAVNDSIQRLLYPISPQNPAKDSAYYQAITLERVRQLFQEKFGNMAHFTFCIAGDVPEAQARQLTERYIASLPGVIGTTPRHYIERDLSAPQKEIVATFTADLPGDIGQVEYSYSADKELTDREQKTLKIIEGILQAYLFDELREKETITYGIAVQANYLAYPKPSETINIRIETGREKVDLVRHKIEHILQALSDGTVDPKYFKQTKVRLAMDEKMQTPPPHKGATDSGDTTEAENPLLRIALLNAYMETGKLPTQSQSRTDTPDGYEEIHPQEVPRLIQKILPEAKSRIIVVQSTPPDPNSLHKH